MDLIVTSESIYDANSFGINLPMKNYYSTETLLLSIKNEVYLSLSLWEASVVVLLDQSVYFTPLTVLHFRVVYNHDLAFVALCEDSSSPLAI